METTLSHPEALKQVNAEITRYMPHLGKCMIYVLSLYVLGVVVMRHCGQSRVAAFVSGMTGSKFGTIRQRLREFTYEASQKRGPQRQAVDVNACFGPLMRWVLSKFSGDHKQVVVAVDATHLRDRFVILCVSVVVAGCAIPVAWHIQESQRPGSWHPIWEGLLAHIKPGIPTDWTVFVLSDSGLYSKHLFDYLSQDMPGHPLMRIDSAQGLFQRQGRQQWRPIRELVYRGMPPTILVGHCFKGKPIACTLILQWDTVYEKPCVLVTTLPPAQVQPNVYAIRYWIECGFKDVKRGLFHWEHTKMTCPARAQRLWLVISIALLWLTALGDTAATTPRWQSLHQARPDARILSAPLLGWIDVILTLLQPNSLSFGSFQPYPWLPAPDE